MLSKVFKFQIRNRIGNLARHAMDIKKYKYFSVTNFADLLGKKKRAPLTTELNTDLNTSSFDHFNDDDGINNNFELLFKR